MAIFQLCESSHHASVTAIRSYFSKAPCFLLPLISHAACIGTEALQLVFWMHQVPRGALPQTSGTNLRFSPWLPTVTVFPALLCHSGVHPPFSQQFKALVKSSASLLPYKFLPSWSVISHPTSTSLFFFKGAS